MKNQEQAAAPSALVALESIVRTQGPHPGNGAVFPWIWLMHKCAHGRVERMGGIPVCLDRVSGMHYYGDITYENRLA